MGWLADIFKGGAEGIISSVGETVDRFVTTDEEKKELELALRKVDLDFQKMQMDLEGAYIKDRSSARAMYEKDADVQKVLALLFTGGYFLMTGLMVFFVLRWIGVVENGVEVPAWAVSLISTVFGAFSAKLNTVVDFFFGGSQGERESRQIQSEFESARDSSLDL